MKIRGALETPDRRWRVEIVQQGTRVFYRLIHGDDIRQPLGIGAVQHLLGDAGVDMADLVEAPAESTA